MKKFLLVDGYNIIFAHQQLSDLVETSSMDHARVRLIHQLANFSGFTEETIILVFDAHKVNDGIEHVEIRDNITVVYTKEKETADQYIERTSRVLTKKYKVRVATSDYTEQVIIMGQGARTVSSEAFEMELRAAEKKIKEIIDKTKPIKKNLMAENVKNQDALNFLEQLRLTTPEPSHPKPKTTKQKNKATPNPQSKHQPEIKLKLHKIETGLKNHFTPKENTKYIPDKPASTPNAQPLKSKYKHKKKKHTQPSVAEPHEHEPSFEELLNLTFPDENPHQTKKRR